MLNSAVQSWPHLDTVLVVTPAGVQGIVNFLGTLALWLTIITFALLVPVFAKAGLQWAFGGGLLGDEHSIRGAVTSMKAVITGAIITGASAALALIVSALIGSITGSAPPPIPIPTPPAGALFPQNVALLTQHVLSLISLTPP